MEACSICNLQYERPNKNNHYSTNTNLAVKNQYYCRQGKQEINLAD